MFIWLTIFFYGSLATIIGFAITDHLPASPIVGSLFAAVTNLTYGYAASYIFYYINIHRPQKAKKDEDYKVLGETYAKIFHNFLELERTYNITANPNDHYKLKRIITNNADPIFTVLFTGECCSLYGQVDDSTPYLPASLQESMAHIVKTLTQKGKPDKVSDYSSSPRTAIVIALYGTARMLTELLRSQEQLPTACKLKIHKTISLIDVELTNKTWFKIITTPPQIPTVELVSTLIRVHAELNIILDSDKRLYQEMEKKTLQHNKAIKKILETYYEEYITTNISILYGIQDEQNREIEQFLLKRNKIIQKYKRDRQRTEQTL